MDASFWSGRNVLITGHTGFKGSWLSLWLSSLGANVVGFSLAPPTEPSLFAAARISQDIVDLRGDVRDLPALQAAIAKHRPEVVLHLAAQPLVRLSYAQPIETFSTNVLGTAHVLEAARHAPSVRAIVVVTSDKCYDNREWVWSYRENEALGGHDPYSASKGCAEIVAAAYRQSFFETREQPCGVATARAGNVIGGGDWALDRLLPDAARALSQGRELVARRPTSVRPWQHVLEPLCGYLTLAERLFAQPDQFAGAWNFGPGEDDTACVGDVLDRFVREWGAGSWSAEPSVSGPHEARLLKLDSSKARHELGWKPALSLDEAIALTARWYQQAATSDQYDVRQLTLDQIGYYERSAGIAVSRRTTVSRPPATKRQAA